MEQKSTKTIQVRIGNDLVIGGGAPIVVQTMCNTHTCDVDATVEQCLELASAGAQMVRITVPGLQDVPAVRAIKSRLRASGCKVPLVADIHFSAQTAIAVAPIVEKVRINPGNFNPDHETARHLFAEFLEVCKANGTAVRVGLNHGSLGKYITDLYGNTPSAMAKAAMEWLQMCIDADFYNVVVSLKASNTVVMVQAYRELHRMMQENGVVFPMHLGVTEAGNGDAGRIKSAVGIGTLLSEGIGDTIRVSLTEPPVAELPVAKFIADCFSSSGPGRLCQTRPHFEKRLTSLAPAELRNSRLTAPSPSQDALRQSSLRDTGVSRSFAAPLFSKPSLTDRPGPEEEMLLAALEWGPKLLNREIDAIPARYWEDAGIDAARAAYLEDEIMQASRRRFYRPEYIACPGCGRTMYDLQNTFEEVKRRTSHLKGMVIAVMGCIVNGPGEMADADWGYVGEGGGKVTIYRKNEPVLRHIPDTEAIDRLLELIRQEQ